MPNLVVDGEPVEVPEGSTVLTAVLKRCPIVRIAIYGRVRGPLCGMGVCYECRVRINDVSQQKACQILAEEGMKVETVA